ncbi:MAG: formate dehydrogenase accessory sulfurtransferase FdhD [Rhizobiales bacterium]|nr:formate dehydrogenase accessory sulfurtransferase FdhD [Hyphomicrobiales bacterium]OJX98805.1 MAG: sulfurtransferase FdhD [Rhizobiales bacterium 63-22]
MNGQDTIREAAHLAHRGTELRPGSRVVPEETPVAMSYNGSTQAVMMATPADIEDFAVGFSLTEGIVRDLAEIEKIDIVVLEQGIDAQMRLSELPERQLAARRRFMAGPVGCGLCGIDSIEQALRPLPPLGASGAVFSAGMMIDAMSALSSRQELNAVTRAVHGAGFYSPAEGLLAVREDVGRHNALDKLVGAVARGGMAAGSGIVAVTSRVSVEMVQKTVMMGAPVLAAISAPTALAIRSAEAAGLTLVALVRGGDFDIYTHGDRIAAD